MRRAVDLGSVAARFARFVGETNAIAGRVSAVGDGLARLDTALGSLQGRGSGRLAIGQAVTLYVRPEALQPGAGANSLRARLTRMDFEGAFALAHGRLQDGATLTVAVTSTRLGDVPPVGTDASFVFAPEHAVVLADA